jgi:hypothetical protein
MKHYLLFVILVTLCSCDKFMIYKTNDYSSDIATFSKRGVKKCVTDTIKKMLKIPPDMDTTKNKWYYYYYGMEAHFIVTEVLYFKDQKELVGVDLSAGRIINYYNPSIAEKCFSMGLWGKDSMKVVRALKRASKRIDSLIAIYETKCLDNPKMDTIVHEKISTGTKK